MGDSHDRLTLDAIFTILSNSRRRHVIRYLNSNGDESVRLGDLAEQIAAWENGVSVQEVTYDQRKRVYTSLYQSHLKKMDELGIVRYQKDRGNVERTATTVRLGEHLDSVSGEERSWAGLQLGIAGLCSIAVAAAWSGVFPVDSITGFVAAITVATIFLLVSVVLFASTR